MKRIFPENVLNQMPCFMDIPTLSCPSLPSLEIARLRDKALAQQLAEKIIYAQKFVEGYTPKSDMNQLSSEEVDKLVLHLHTSLRLEYMACIMDDVEKYFINALDRDFARKHFFNNHPTRQELTVPVLTLQWVLPQTAQDPLSARFQLCYLTPAQQTTESYPDQVNSKKGSAASQHVCLMFTGAFSIHLYDDKARFIVDRLVIDIMSRNTVRFSPEPLQIQMDKSSRVGKVLLSHLGENIVTQRRRFRSLSSLMSQFADKAIYKDYYGCDLAETSLLCKLNAEQTYADVIEIFEPAVKGLESKNQSGNPKNTMGFEFLPKSAATNEKSPEQKALINRNAFWRSLECSMQHPVPCVIHKALTDLAVYELGAQKGFPDPLSIISKNSKTTNGSMKDSTLIWWSALDGDKSEFIANLVKEQSSSNELAQVLCYAPMTGEWQGANAVLLLAQKGQWALLEQLKTIINLPLDSSFENPYHPSYKMNVLSFAIRDEKWDWVMSLLSKNINVSEFHDQALLDNKFSWLNKLIMNKKWLLISTIINKNNQIIQRQGSKLLYFAAMESEWSVVKMLLEHGVYSNDMFIHFHDMMDYFGKKDIKNQTVAQLILSRLLTEGTDFALFEDTLAMLETLFKNYKPKTAKEDDAFLLNLLHPFDEEHPWGPMSFIMVLASLNDLKLSSFDERRFKLIENLFVYYEANRMNISQFSQRINIEKNGYPYSLCTFFAQCQQANFLKHLYLLLDETPNLKWLDVRVSDYELSETKKTPSKLKKQYEPMVNDLLKTLHVFKNINILNYLCQATDKDFEILYALKNISARIKYLALQVNETSLVTSIVQDKSVATSTATLLVERGLAAQAVRLTHSDLAKNEQKPQDNREQIGAAPNLLTLYQLNISSHSTEVEQALNLNVSAENDDSSKMKSQNLKA